MECNAPILHPMKKEKTAGTALTVKYECLNGHEGVWTSQERFQGKRTFEGNVRFVLATLLTGLTFTAISSFFSTFNILGLAKSTFYAIQAKVGPTINRCYQMHHETVLDTLKEQKFAVLAGDGRYVSVALFIQKFLDTF